MCIRPTQGQGNTVTVFVINFGRMLLQTRLREGRGRCKDHARMILEVIHDSSAGLLLCLNLNATDRNCALTGRRALNYILRP